MPSHTQSPHGRIKDLPDYSYDDVDYGTMLDVARGRRFRGSLEKLAKSTSERYEPSYIPENTYKVEMGEAEKLGKDKAWMDALRKMVHTGGGKVRVLKEEDGIATITTQHAWGFNMGELKIPKSALKKATILPMQIVQPWTDANGNPVNPDKMQIQPLRARRDYGEIEAEIVKRMMEAAEYYFTKEEMALPKEAHQLFNNQSELYEEASNADKQMSYWLDEMSKRMSLVHYHQMVYGFPQIEYKDKSWVLITTPMKLVQRAREKVDNDYDGDWSLLVDIVRATIGVNKYDEIGEVIRILRQAGMKLARRPKDFFKDSRDDGYRGIHLNIVLPNGHIGELQIHIKPILKARDEELHQGYEVLRNLDTIMRQEGRKDYTPKEKELKDTINDLMKIRFDEVWERAER